MFIKLQSQNLLGPDLHILTLCCCVMQFNHCIVTDEVVVGGRGSCFTLSLLVLSLSNGKLTSSSWVLFHRASPAYILVKQKQMFAQQ